MFILFCRFALAEQCTESTKTSHFLGRGRFIGNRFEQCGIKAHPAQARAHTHSPDLPHSIDRIPPYSL